METPSEATGSDIPQECWEEAGYHMLQDSRGAESTVAGMRVLGPGDLATGVRICAVQSSDTTITVDLLADDGRTGSVTWKILCMWTHARTCSVLTMWHENQEGLLYLCDQQGEVRLGPEGAFL